MGEDEWIVEIKWRRRLKWGRPLMRPSMRPHRVLQSPFGLNGLLCGRIAGRTSFLKVPTLKTCQKPTRNVNIVILEFKNLVKTKPKNTHKRWNHGKWSTNNQRKIEESQNWGATWWNKLRGTIKPSQHRQYYSNTQTHKHNKNMKNHKYNNKKYEKISAKNLKTWVASQAALV